MNKYKTLVLDDDKQIRFILESIIKNNAPDLEYVGSANTVSSSIKLIEKEEPDLVFLDIGFPDGDGFSILDQSSYSDFEIIFITSFDEFALKAFEYSALHYLKKPIIPLDVLDAIKRFITLKREEKKILPISKLKSLLIHDEPKLIIPTTECLNVIKINNIIRCEANDVYTYFYLITDERIIASKSLNNYEKLLSDINFVRIHNKHLINLRYIIKYHKGKGGSVIMENGKEIEVSVRKKMDFMNKLKDYARSLK